jgi:GST-like protein
MIDLHTWKSPGGNKIQIMLEETGLAYQLHLVDIAAGEQRRPAFLTINPNAKIPAIVDQEGPGGRPFAVFESGAILLYLAEKTGRFLPVDARARAAVLEWLMFEVASVGPMFGQCYHFRSAAPERIPYAITRYTNEVGRLYGVLDRRLGETAPRARRNPP